MAAAMEEALLPEFMDQRPAWLTVLIETAQKLMFKGSANEGPTQRVLNIYPLRIPNAVNGGIETHTH